MLRVPAMRSCMVAVAALCLTIGAANASTIYDNGGPNNVGGYEATRYVEADDFTLAEGGIVTGAGVYLAGYGGITAWSGVLTYWIFAEDETKPGTILQHGNAMGLTVSDSGIPWCCGGNAYLVEFSFVSPFAALPGVTYWLGIRASDDPEFPEDHIYWVTTDANGTMLSRYSYLGTFDNWFAADQLAFYLTGSSSVGVPEPASLALLGAGLMGLGFAARRRRAV